MNHELICSWLEIAADQWPPNHYALLGLEPCEPNIERIEQLLNRGRNGSVKKAAQ